MTRADQNFFTLVRVLDITIKTDITWFAAYEFLLWSLGSYTDRMIGQRRLVELLPAFLRRRKG